MKKIIFSLGVLSLLIQIPVFAEETKQEAMSATLTDQSAAIPTTNVKRGAWSNNPQMVLSNNGGVIILLGYRLMKYDADLNLVKEVMLTSIFYRITPIAAKADQPPVATKLREKVI